MGNVKFNEAIHLTKDGKQSIAVAREVRAFKGSETLGDIGF